MLTTNQAKPSRHLSTDLTTTNPRDCTHGCMLRPLLSSEKHLWNQRTIKNSVPLYSLLSNETYHLVMATPL